MQPPNHEPGNGEARISYADLIALSDERVMQELQAGNTDAFAVIFKRFHRLVHVTALRILRDAAEAEDLTQAVFLEVYRKAHQFDATRGTAKIWLLQYAYGRSMNRRNYLLVRQVHRQTDISSIEDQDCLWSPARLLVQEATRLTGEVLSALTEAQRQTIELFFFEGLTLREIAEHRKETLSNVRHHYYRGMEKLKRCLQEPSSSPETAVSYGEVRRVET